MDKRKKKTSVNQYTIYLKMLEEDEVFRTGIVPDNYDMSYIHNKWKQLSDSLNLCPLGPQLSADEWKKRLMDWKHTTRSKHRKSLGKPSPDKPKIQITALEKKAISLWGPGPTENVQSQRIVIKNEPQITYKNDQLASEQNTEYIDKSKQNQDISYQDDQEEICGERNSKRFKIIDEVILPSKQEDPIAIYVPDNEQDITASTDYETTADKNRKRNTITEIENQSISIIDINNIGHQLKRLADLKQEKLKFEISKFKFKNPGFNYDI